MADVNRYQVDPDEVDRVVRDMYSQIDEFGKLSGQLSRLTPPVSAFGGIGVPAATAAVAAHELLQQANQALGTVLNQATQNMQTAMNNYRQADASGATSISAVSAGLGVPGSLLQNLRVGGLGASAIHTYLQDQSKQVGAGIAEVYVGGDLADVRVRPGDLVTTADFAATVGPDGRLYANGQPVQHLSGTEARVYRSMGTTAATEGYA
ncbi:hypothetical protein [Rugosimonospora africana]|nr:hypothetical protein [Rugosimonospora africana]